MPGKVLSVIILLGAIVPAAQLPCRYSARLTGDQAVPATESSATGDALFFPNRENTALRCRVTVDNLNNDGALVVALYLGRPDEPPQPELRVAVLPLAGPVRKGNYSGVLVQTTLTDSALTGPLAGRRLENLIYALSLGRIFVNIASGSYPEGEIRGQVR